MAETRDDILHGLFTTACEGGINYWAQVLRYRWSMGGDGETNDLEHFFATIADADDNDFGEDRSIDVLRIDRTVVNKGLTRYVHQAWPSGSYQQQFAYDAMRAKWDDCDYDADIADMIVQLGLFGEVRFG